MQFESDEELVENGNSGTLKNKDSSVEGWQEKI